MNYPNSMAQWLGLPWQGVLATIITTVAIYIVFLIVTRIMGARMLASLTTFDTLMALLFGSMIARTSLGTTPTLVTGVTAFLTLVALHFTLGKFANTAFGDRALNSRAKLLMAGETLCEENMRRTHTTRIELRSALRTAGIRERSEVAAVILEPTGKLSIYRVGKPIDPNMLSDVQGAELIPREYLNTSSHVA